MTNQEIWVEIDEPSALPGYFIAIDASREPTLWCGDPEDPFPLPVLGLRDVADFPEVWALLVASCHWIGEHE